MRSKDFKPEEHIADLNNLKRNLMCLNRPFSRSLFISGLKGIGLPDNDVFWMAVKRSGIVQQLSRGCYIFKNDKPIHISVLAKIHKDYRKIVCDYSKTYREKHSSKEVEKPVEAHVQLEPVHELTEENAVKLLKELGYIIYKPEVAIFYKKL
jgi:hypothetical protein